MKNYIVGLVITTSFLYLAVNSTNELNIYDEGFVVTNAINILDGKIPYKDFTSLYTPGQYYLFALLFKLFGPYIIVERIWESFIRLCLLISIFAVCSQITSKKISLISVAVLFVLLGSTNFFGYPVFIALVFSFITFYFLFKYLDNKKSFFVLLSGISTGFVTLFRHDIGLQLFIITFGLFVWLGFKKNTRTILTFIFGMIIIIIPVVLYFLLSVPLITLYENLIGYQVFVMHGVRKLYLPHPFPYINIHEWIRFYFLPLVYFIFSFHVFFKKNSQSFVSTKRTILLVFGVLSFLQSLNRVDQIHLLPTTIIALPLACILIVAGIRTSSSKYISFIYGLILMILLKTYVYEPLLVWKNTFQNVTSQTYQMELSTQPERSRFVHIDPNQSKAILYIQANTSKHDTIYVGLSRHDKAFINDASFYFLADRKTPKYYELDPGIITTKHVQQELIEELKVKKIPYVVLLSRFENHQEPNKSVISSGVTILDEYIQSHYTPVQQYGDYRILVSKSL